MNTEKHVDGDGYNDADVNQHLMFTSRSRTSTPKHTCHTQHAHPCRPTDEPSMHPLSDHDNISAACYHIPHMYQSRVHKHQCIHRVGVVGLGVVGRALSKIFLSRGLSVGLYDVVDEIVERTVASIPKCRLEQLTVASSVADLARKCRGCLVLALPTSCTTPENGGFSLKPIQNVLGELADFVDSENMSYQSSVFLCSTVTPGTTDQLWQQHPHLRIFHLPEFLSADTAAVDVADPVSDLLVGVPDGMPSAAVDRARKMVNTVLVAPNQSINMVSAVETECTKLFCNAFYATKVQLFNEFYQLCAVKGVSYTSVKRLMVHNGWIHPMHTDVPGSDGKFGFGGHCLPKDLRALVGWSRTLKEKRLENSRVVTTSAVDANTHVLRKELLRTESPSLLETALAAHELQKSCERNVYHQMEPTEYEL